MVEITGTYEGGLRCDSRHGPSGNRLATDAPVDNRGRGESYSPTDLVATALGTCILTTMAIVAEGRGIDLTGARYRVRKHMVADPKRRIGKLETTIWLPEGIPERERKILERTAHACPVHQSLHERVELPIEFR